MKPCVLELAGNGDRLRRYCRAGRARQRPRAADGRRAESQCRPFASLHGCGTLQIRRTVCLSAAQDGRAHLAVASRRQNAAGARPRHVGGTNGGYQGKRSDVSGRRSRAQRVTSAPTLVASTTPRSKSACAPWVREAHDLRGGDVALAKLHAVAAITLQRVDRVTVRAQTEHIPNVAMAFPPCPLRRRR